MVFEVGRVGDTDLDLLFSGPFSFTGASTVYGNFP